jgi:hypothetical protein
MAEEEAASCRDFGASDDSKGGGGGDLHGERCSEGLVLGSFVSVWRLVMDEVRGW